MSCKESRCRILARLVTAAVFSLCLTSISLAQTQGKPAGAGPPPNINPNIDTRQRQVDENRLRSAELNVDAEEGNKKRLEAAILNMKEDFTRIQVLRNDIARNLIAQKPLNHKLLSEQTAEINKRASRLNVYMRAHTEEEKESNTAEIKSEEMVDALVRLCKLIDSFTENPALKNAATVDSKEIGKVRENKANADRDLLAIIKLSSSLQKKSDSLRTP
jgi:hypothetical protein